MREKKGFRTYPRGYNPTATARFIGIKAYRNVEGGMFLHRNSNFHIEDSIFADNGIGIDFDETDSPPIRLTNVTIIGLSESYRTNVWNKNKGNVCSLDGKNIGIEVLTRKANLGKGALLWNKIDFSGFNHDDCNNVIPISLLDDRVSCG